MAAAAVQTKVGPADVAIILTFEKDEAKIALGPGVLPIQGRCGGSLGFTASLQNAHVQFSRVLDGIDAMIIGGWFALPPER